MLITYCDSTQQGGYYIGILDEIKFFNEEDEMLNIVCFRKEQNENYQRILICITTFGGKEISRNESYH